MLDAFDGRGHIEFVVVDDAARELFRQHSAISPDDRHNGNVDVWKDVRGCFEHGHDAEHQNQNR